MSKIFAIGVGPLLEEGVRRFSGQALRTTHFIKPLLDAGHEIDLYVHPISDVDYDPERDAPSSLAEWEGLAYTKLQTNSEEIILPYLQDCLERFQPDALLGVNSFPSHLACNLRAERPVWCDLNGYGMVEAQTHSRVYDSDDCLPHFRRHELSFVRRGDRFSTVSTPQQYALLGELALCGRLNQYTFDYDFACAIPEALAARFHALDGSGRPPGEGEFRVFWCGSFNTWTDVELLHDALSRAMARAPELRFVSTGGAIAGHNEKTYAQFEELARGGPHPERFELLGWVEPEEVDRQLLRCDLGINIDSKNYDTVFGARNRITTMAGCGMPVLTTIGTEVSRELHRRDLGLFVEIGDTEGLVEALLYAVSHRAALRELGRRSREFVLEAWNYESTTRELVEWLAAPQLAPDNARRVAAGAGAEFLQRRPLNGIERELARLDETPARELLEDQRDLEALRGKTIFKIARAFGLV